MDYKYFKFCALVLTVAFLVSCASSNIKTVNDAKESYDYAMKLMEAGRYQQARETFQEIKNKLPDSSYAALSELRMADSYYDEESYPEAIAAYEVFEELHPKHPEREYVVFRIAMSHYNDTPSAIDRDLEPAYKAIKNFKRLLELYPDSKHKESALIKMKEAREKILGKENYIAYYYFTRGIYKSAIPRYEEIIKDYSDIKNVMTEKAMYELWVSYKKIKDEGNQKRIKELFAKDYPKSKYSLK